jgi:hypothetical protein
LIGVLEATMNAPDQADPPDSWEEFPLEDLLRQSLAGPMSPAVRRWVEKLLAGDQPGPQEKEAGPKTQNRRVRKGTRRCRRGSA